jgi:mycothiol synthase
MTSVDGTLPVGYAARPPTLDDAQAAYDLATACSIAETGTVGVTLAEIRASLAQTTTDAGVDALAIFTAEGELVARATTYERAPAQFWIWTEVHPAHRDHGLDGSLLHWAEAQIGRGLHTVPPDLRVTARQQIVATDERARALAEQNGYLAVRRSWRMRLEMDGTPPVPTWPVGIAVRTFVPGQDDYAVYEAAEEAFADHWDHVPEDFDDYEAYFQREDFDPTLTFLAVAGQDIAGVVLCEQREERGADMSMALGWIESLSVRSSYRHRGIGLALLHQAFGEFYRRGVCRVALFVDAQNTTGAMELYRAAGMQPYREWIDFEKEVRPAGASDPGDGYQSNSTPGSS